MGAIKKMLDMGAEVDTNFENELLGLTDEVSDTKKTVTTRSNTISREVSVSKYDDGVEMNVKHCMSPLDFGEVDADEAGPTGMGGFGGGMMGLGGMGGMEENARVGGKINSATGVASVFGKNKFGGFGSGGFGSGGGFGGFGGFGGQFSMIKDPL